MDKIVKRDLYTLIDESITKIDERIERLVFCATEISAESLEKAQESFSQLSERIGLADGKKFHFTDINDVAIRMRIIDIIAKLGVKNKTFVFYGNIPISELKTEAVKKVLADMNRQLSKRYNIKYIVENSSEYRAIIKERCLTVDKTLTIIPDAFCYAAVQRLDYTRREIVIAGLKEAKLLNSKYDDRLEKEHAIYYNKLFPLNRLEVYDFSNCKNMRLERNARLRPLDEKLPE